MRKGPKIKEIEEKMGCSIEELIQGWIDEGIAFYSALRIVFKKFGIYSNTEKRSIRRSLWRFINNNFPEYKEVIASQGRGNQYLEIISRHYRIQPHEVVEYIIERKITLAEVTRDAVPEQLSQKVYVWLYNFILNHYGKDAVKPLCKGVAHRRTPDKVSPSYYGVPTYDWYFPVNVTAAPSRYY